MSEYVKFHDSHVKCPIHGFFHPISEHCPRCWDEIKNGNVSGRPSVPHYQQGGIEPIDYIRANNLNHLEGCIIKYVTRWPFKGDPIGDLEKARDYLNWLIEDARSIPNAPCRCAKGDNLAAKDGVFAIDADKLGPQKTPPNKR